MNWSIVIFHVPKLAVVNLQENRKSVWFTINKEVLKIEMIALASIPGI